MSSLAASFLRFFIISNYHFRLLNTAQYIMHFYCIWSRVLFESFHIFASLLELPFFCNLIFPYQLQINLHTSLFGMHKRKIRSAEKLESNFLIILLGSIWIKKAGGISTSHLFRLKMTRLLALWVAEWSK